MGSKGLEGGLVIASGILAATWGFLGLLGNPLSWMFAAASAIAALGASALLARSRSESCKLALSLGMAGFAASIIIASPIAPAAAAVVSASILSCRSYRPLAALALVVALAGIGLYALEVEVAIADYRLASGLSLALAGFSLSASEIGRPRSDVYGNEPRPISTPTE